MIFQEIRNATIKLKYDDICFLIDPWLQDACTEEEREQAAAAGIFIEKPAVPLPLSPGEILHDVDVCIVSHDHADHFTPDYLPADLPLVCQNQTDSRKAESLGFTDVHYFENDEMQFGSVTVKRVDGRHGDTDILARKAGPVSGFVFSCEGQKKLYAAGDTIFCDVVEKIIREEKPDIIIVNCCDAETRSGRLIMNAEDVVRTCRCMNGGLVIASHMDTVTHAHLTRKQLKEYLEREGFSGQVMIPADGEEIRFDG